MNRDELVFALDGAGWQFLTSPQSSWVVVKRHGHIIAGYSLSNVAARATEAMEGHNAPQKLQGQRY